MRYTIARYVVGGGRLRVDAFTVLAGTLCSKSRLGEATKSHQSLDAVNMMYACHAQQ